MNRLVAFIASFLVCSAAWGHAALVAVSPAPGAVLQAPPADVVLSFNEPVGVTALQLFGPGGQKLATGPVADHNREIRIPLPAAPAAHGTYLLSWRVISADGHPVGGTLDYSIGQPSASAGVPQAASSGSMKFAIWLARWLTYLCLFAAVGAALFRMANPPDRQAWARPAIALGLILLPVNLGLQGLDMRGVSWGALMESATWAQALSSTYAQTLGLDALALLAALAALALQRQGASKVAALASLGLAGVAMAVSGHAGTVSPQWLSRSAVTLHVMMAIAWVGTLVPLARSLRRVRTAAIRQDSAPPSQAGQPGLEPLVAFSRWIVPAVALLAACGLTLAWLQFDRVDDLWRTDYGRVLLAKLSLVALLLCLAAYNRWSLTRAALAGGTTARARLVAAIRTETVLAVLILSVVSLWRFTPPPRSADLQQAAVPGVVTLSDRRVRVHVAPRAEGWRITLAAPDGKPFQAQGVTLSLSNAAAGIEPLRRTAQRQADGSWLAAMPSLSADTPWQVGVKVLVDDFDEITLRATSSAADAAPPAVDPMAGMPMASVEPDSTAHGHAMHGARSPAATQGIAQEIARASRTATLTVSDCWVRLLPRPVPSAAYFVVRNSGDAAGTLLGADTTAFADVMLHRTVDKGGMSTMQAAGDIVIPAHGKLAFAPGGYHAMLDSPADGLAAGVTIEMRFLFDGSRYTSAPCAVKPPSFVSHE